MERKVIDLVSKQCGIPKVQIRPDSRLVEDLGIDSLDMVELTMALEETFEITIPDEYAKGFFVRHPEPATIGTMAKMVVERWGTGTPQRHSWFKKRIELKLARNVPFTQGETNRTSKDWKGLLYETLGTNREGFQHFLRRSDGMRCVQIPADTVQIGNPSSNAPYDQKPEHSVQLSSYLIDAEPVSNAAYAGFLNAIQADDSIISQWCAIRDRRKDYFQLGREKSKWKPIPKTEHQPVILISWYGANAYSLWANRRNWRYYCGHGKPAAGLANGDLDLPAPSPNTMYSFLPSEAQWEFAARGKSYQAFPWGSELPDDDLARVARHYAKRTYEVDKFPAADVNECLGMSPFGLHHMAGNVWQWCRDWYSPEFYKTSGSSNPQNEIVTNVRSERGGSWVSPPELASSSYRRGRPPGAFGRCLGFRCVGIPPG